MKRAEFEEIRERFHEQIRRHQIDLAKREMQLAQVPSKELEREVATRKGYVQGLRKGFELLEAKSSLSLPLGGA